MNTLLRVAALFVAVAFAAPAVAQDIPAHTTEYPGAVADMVLGNPDAPVSIIEYSSLTCPHCAAFHADTLVKIKENWIKPGKAKLIYRDFPLDGVAMGAAMLARCMPPESYFAFLDTLFSTQKTWAYSSNPLAALQNLARFAGIPDDRFKACLSDQAVMQGIQKKQADAEAQYKINSTPQFVVDDKVLPGNLPYEAFDKALTAAQ